MMQLVSSRLVLPLIYFDDIINFFFAFYFLLIYFALQLAYCIVQFLEKDPSLTKPVSFSKIFIAITFLSFQNCTFKSFVLNFVSTELLTLVLNILIKYSTSVSFKEYFFEYYFNLYIYLLNRGYWFAVYLMFV